MMNRLQSVRIAAKDSPVLIIGTHVEHELCTEDFLADMRQKFVTSCSHNPLVLGTKAANLGLRSE